MKGIVIESPGVQRFVDLQQPSPGPDEVLVQVRYAGVCRSDLELFDGSRPPSHRRYPVTPGHEWSGVVLESGPQARRFRPGQRVVAGGILFCEKCENCSRGRTNLCSSGYSEIGFTRPGAFAEALVVPARSLEVVPDDVSLKLAALAEPGACAFHGVCRAAIKEGETVLVIGAGTIGLLAVALANHARPGRLVVLGNDSARNQIALLLGASHAVLAGPDAVERVRELTGGGPHVVIEAAGTPLAVEQAFDVVRPGGRVVLEGVIGGGHRSCLATDEWVVKDITVHGVMGADRASVRGVVDLLSRGLLNVLPVIRDVLPLAEFPEALRRLREERECPPKILLAARSG